MDLNSDLTLICPEFNPFTALVAGNIFYNMLTQFECLFFMARGMSFCVVGFFNLFFKHALDET